MSAQIVCQEFRTTRSIDSACGRSSKVSRRGRHVPTQYQFCNSQFLPIASSYATTWKYTQKSHAKIARKCPSVATPKPWVASPRRLAKFKCLLLRINSGIVYSLVISTCLQVCSSLRPVTFSLSNPLFC